MALCRCGVPQLVIPFTSEQALWAERVDYLGLGLGLGSPEALEGMKVEEALRRVVDEGPEGEMRQAVRVYQGERRDLRRSPDCGREGGLMGYGVVLVWQDCCGRRMVSRGRSNCWTT